MTETMSQSEVAALLRGEPVPRKRPQRRVTSLVLELPHPGEACNPNRGKNWRQVAKCRKAMKEAAAIIARHELTKLNAAPPRWEHAEVQATFHRPGKRSKLLDRDNAIAMCKGAFDGLQEAGVIVNDSGLVPLPPVQIIGDEATERKLVLVVAQVLTAARETANGR